MDIRTYTTLIAILGFVLVGCPADEPGGGDDDDDDSANPGDDDDVFGDDDDMAGDTDGTVSLMQTTTGSMDLGVIFSATFATIVTPAEPGYVTNMPAGQDDCAITFFTAEELTGGDHGEYLYESAGTLTLAGGGISLDVVPEDQGGVLTYSDQLPTGQFTFGVDYGVTASGDVFPAFSGVLEMTDQIVLTQPDPQGMVQLGAGDLPVEWSGFDGSEAAIFMTFVDENTDGAVIVCTVQNDGAFTVPGSFMDQLPTGSGSILLEQYNWTQTDAGGRTVSLVAGSVAMATGMTP